MVSPGKREVEVLMMVISTIGLINCICRADYNFPAFAVLRLIFFNVPDDYLPKPDHDHQALNRGALCKICYPDGVDGRTAKPLTEAEIDFYNHEALYSPLYHKKLMMKSKRFRQQRFMTLFMGITLLGDGLWLGYWPFVWFSTTWRTLQPFSIYQHAYVIALSAINFCLKLGLLVTLLTPSLFDMSLKSCCKDGDEIDEIEVRMYHQTPPPGKDYNYYPVPTKEQLIQSGYKDILTPNH